MKVIIFLINAISTFFLLQGVSKELTVLLIILIGLTNFFNGYKYAKDNLTIKTDCKDKC
jgi:hypothetical protein